MRLGFGRNIGWEREFIKTTHPPYTPPSGPLVKDPSSIDQVSETERTTFGYGTLMT